MSTVCYGFLAVLLATRKRPSRRWRYYGAAVAGIVLIALARLYIGAQWFSDVLLGVGVGVAWVSMLSLGYRRHLPQRVRSLSQMPLAMGILLLAAAWQWNTSLDADRAYYRPPAQVQQMHSGEWASRGFATLPAYRIDLAERRRYPLNLQWHAPLEVIIAALAEQGWTQRPDLNLKQALLWLSKTRPVDELALLPQAHDGRLQSLAMTLPMDTERQWVLRLWHSGRQLDGSPLWLGSIAPYGIRNLFDNLRVPWIENDFNQGPALLLKQLDDGRRLSHPDSSDAAASFNWDGRVLLLGARP